MVGIYIEYPTLYPPPPLPLIARLQLLQSRMGIVPSQATTFIGTILILILEPSCRVPVKNLLVKILPHIALCGLSNGATSYMRWLQDFLEQHSPNLGPEVEVTGYRQ